MTNPNPARVRELAESIIMDRINDYDYMGIGEAMGCEDDLKDLPEEEFDAFQLAVDAALSEAAIQIEWPTKLPDPESADGIVRAKTKGWIG